MGKRRKARDFRGKRPLTFPGLLAIIAAMPRRSHAMIALVMCGLLPNVAWALRAPKIESAAVTPPSRLMVEFGHRFEQNARATGRENRQQVTLSQGMQGTQQIDLIVPWRVHHTTQSESAAIGDMALMHKIGALSALGGGSTLLGTFTRVDLPTSKASRAGKDNYQFASSLLLTQATKRSTLTLNAGAVIQTRGDKLMRYGTGLQYVWEKVGLFGELVGFTDFQSNGKNEIVTGEGGLEFLLGKRLTIDVGGQKGITKDAPDWGVLGGATMIF
jgi:hypothetical protein